MTESPPHSFLESQLEILFKHKHYFNCRFPKKLLKLPVSVNDFCCSAASKLAVGGLSMVAMVAGSVSPGESLKNKSTG